MMALLPLCQAGELLMAVTIRCTRDVALQDQRLVQARLRAVVVRIEVAERTGVAAPVLVIALIRRDE